MKSVFILFFFVVIYTNSITLKLTPTPSTFLVSFVGFPHSTTKHSKQYRFCEIMSAGETQFHRLVNNDHSSNSSIYVEKRPMTMVHLDEKKEGESEYVEVFGVDLRSIWKEVDLLCTEKKITPHETSQQQDEVHKLHISGDSSNRIDIVFVGDGYTASQRDLFLDDMKRLHQEMFEGVTFRSFLPLFNVWAVFRASVESGIGKNSRPKNTAYKCYREGNTLRGVYCNDLRAAQDSCSKTGRNACDFPTIIGNDPYYGGLRTGPYTISTSSKTSGTIVLRHEFGHSMGNVGEEYDAGRHYGANAANTLSEVRSKWEKWLTGPVVEQQSAILINDYPWHNLATPKVYRITSTGRYKRWKLKFSVSGCEIPDAISVKLDGKELPWETHGNLDRGFHVVYDWENGLSAGNHELVFAQKIPPRQGEIRMLGDVRFLEYADESGFQWSDKHVNAYPCYEGLKRSAYRPTNERCLMRNMTSPYFCALDQENLWNRFLQRVNLIDDINAHNSNATHAVVRAKLVQVGQLRKGYVIQGEKLQLFWYKAGSEMVQLRDKIEWSLPRESAVGNWQLKVVFSTPEVRTPEKFEFRKNFSLTT